MSKKMVFVWVSVLLFSSVLQGECFDKDGKVIASTKSCCKILDKHVRVLYAFNEANKERSIVDFGDPEGGFPFLLSNFDYHNDVLRMCINGMVKQVSLDPLFKTWDFGQCTDISKQDSEFLREFSILVFSLYENLLVILTANKADIDSHSRGTLNEIIELYNVVSRIPLRELLVTLEKCYVLFSNVMRDYGLLDSEITWGDWLERYWWVVPTVTIAVVASLLQRPGFRPGHGRLLSRL